MEEIRKPLYMQLLVAWQILHMPVIYTDNTTNSHKLHTRRGDPRCSIQKRKTGTDCNQVRGLSSQTRQPSCQMRANNIMGPLRLGPPYRSYSPRTHNTQTHAYTHSHSKSSTWPETIQILSLRSGTNLGTVSINNIVSCLPAPLLSSRGQTKGPETYPEMMSALDDLTLLQQKVPINTTGKPQIVTIYSIFPASS